MNTLERAMAVGNDRVALRKRLNEAKSCLLQQYRIAFRDASFSFRDKTLTSKCGRFQLKWTLRADPDAPESYENQQTGVGCVQLYELLPVDDFIKELVDLTNELAARA